jgi:hypothetical protein
VECWRGGAAAAIKRALRSSSHGKSRRKKATPLESIIQKFLDRKAGEARGAANARKFASAAGDPDSG